MPRYEIRDCWLEGETFNGIYLSDGAIEQAQEQLREGVELRDDWEGKEIGTVTLTQETLIVEVSDGYYPGLPAMHLTGSIEAVDDKTVTVTEIDDISYFLTDGESGARIVTGGEG